MWQGEENAVCFTLTSGALKLSVVDADGDERIVGTAYAADFVGSPFAGESQVQVTALIDSELCIFSRAAFAEALGRDRRLESELLRRTMADLERSRTDLSRLSSLGARARVAALVADLAARSSTGCTSSVEDFWVSLPLSRGEMAALLDLRIETVSRQLGALEADGLIERRGRREVRLSDPHGLNAIGT